MRPSFVPFPLRQLCGRAAKKGQFPERKDYCMKKSSLKFLCVAVCCLMMFPLMVGFAPEKATTLKVATWNILHGNDVMEAQHRQIIDVYKRQEKIVADKERPENQQDDWKCFFHRSSFNDGWGRLTDQGDNRLIHQSSLLIAPVFRWSYNECRFPSC